MAQRVNPRRKPATQADVEKAFDLGFEAGMRDLMDVMVYTLGTECNMSDEWLDFFHARFMKNLECHLHGELSSQDLRNTLYEEKGWEVEVK